MATRITLLCAAATRSARVPRFAAADEPLDAGGRAKARSFAMPGPPPDRCWTSPAAAARETAALLGLDAATVTALGDIDAGAWAGCGLDEIDPAALAVWLSAPERGAPGGEDMAAVVARVGAWLDALGDGRFVAVTHVGVARAAVAHALGIPAAATLAIDLAPLGGVVLSRHARWRVQALGPLEVPLSARRHRGAVDSSP